MTQVKAINPDCSFRGIGNPESMKDYELVLHPRFAAERAVGCGCKALGGRILRAS